MKIKINTYDHFLGSIFLLKCTVCHEMIAAWKDNYTITAAAKTYNSINRHV